MLLLAVTRSFSGDSEICYVSLLMVLWMISCFHMMGPLGQNQVQRYFFSSLPGGTTSRVSGIMFGRVR